MIPQNHYKTIVLSDIHLGTINSKAKELSRFLRSNSCDRLILNGDIIDGWRLSKNGKWKRKHTRFLKVVMKMTEKIKTEVIYVRGNHDDFLDQILPLQFGKFIICRDFELESKGKKFYVTHGDIFDSITTNLRWLAKLGDMGYTFLLWLNKTYNNRRIRKGLPYYSLSGIIKQKVKSAISYISDFQEELTIYAKKKNYDGVICGHIHHPAILQYEETIYMNSGDWIESLSALTEDHQGNWKIVYYHELLKEEKEHAEELLNQHMEHVKEIKNIKVAELI